MKKVHLEDWTEFDELVKAERYEIQEGLCNYPECFEGADTSMVAKAIKILVNKIVELEQALTQAKNEATKEGKNG